MDEAERLVDSLRRVPPQHATGTTIAEADRVLDLLADRRDSQLGLEVQVRLASFLLESPDGDPAANVARAAQLYRAVRGVSSPDGLPQAWQAATLGLANSLARSTDTLAEALRLFEEAATVAGARGDRAGRAAVLGAYATTLARAPGGARAEIAERVLGLRLEVASLLQPREDAPESDRDVWGRAMHNLGVGFAQRLRGAQPDNVNSAIMAFRQALTVRSMGSDPVGRARTLRALAVLYPEWSGADSAADADQLAREARAEADWIDQHDARAASRTTGWAFFERQASALNRDLDPLYRLPEDERVPHLEAMIANHRAALDVVTEASLPTRWAEWMGGLGRLLGRFPSLGHPDAVREAYACFQRALGALDPTTQPRLWRDIAGRFGELGHEIGDWEASYRAHASALEVSDTLFDQAGAADGRTQELLDSRGFALFGAYAAARAGKPAEAVRLAEMGRSRAMVDMLASSEAVRADAPPDVRATIAEKRARIAEIEAQLTAESAADPERALVDMTARLADALRADPDLVKTRLTSGGLPDRGAGAARYAELSARLHALRVELRAAVAAVRAGESVVTLTAEQIQDIAGRAGHPIVYVMATVHGAMALAVPPSGELTAIRIDELTSDDTMKVALGEDGRPGFVQSAFHDEDADTDHMAISAALDAVLTTVGESLLDPILSWLAERSYDRMALVPMERLGLLPLHMAIDGAVVSYVASARTLRHALSTPRPAPGAARTLLAIGNPERSDVPALPSAAAEARTVAATFGDDAAATVLLGGQATAAAVGNLVSGATHLHLACHAHYRPSDPQASTLLLAGEDQLTLGDLLAGTPRMSGVRLAVLSACQTGNVEFRRLPDEVVGFPAGLHLAGVPGVVATLWPVEDRAAAALMSRFYRLHLHEGWPAAGALQQAQRWLRDATEGELHEHWLEIARALDEPDPEVEALAFGYPRRSRVRRYRDPYYWAAFAYSGAEDPVE